MDFETPDRLASASRLKLRSWRAFFKSKLIHHIPQVFLGNVNRHNISDLFCKGEPLWIYIGYNNVSRTCMTRHGSGHYANGSCACYQYIRTHLGS